MINLLMLLFTTASCTLKIVSPAWLAKIYPGHIIPSISSFSASIDGIAVFLRSQAASSHQYIENRINIITDSSFEYSYKEARANGAIGIIFVINITDSELSGAVISDNREDDLFIAGISNKYLDIWMQCKNDQIELSYEPDINERKWNITSEENSDKNLIPYWNLQPEKHTLLGSDSTDQITAIIAGIIVVFVIGFCFCFILCLCWKNIKKLCEFIYGPYPRPNQPEERQINNINALELRPLSQANYQPSHNQPNQPHLNWSQEEIRNAIAIYNQNTQNPRIESPQEVQEVIDFYTEYATTHQIDDPYDALKFACRTVHKNALGVEIDEESNYGFYGENNCTICFDEIRQEDMKITKCRHIFHKNCLKEWLDQKGLNAKCPLCNKNLNN